MADRRLANSIPNALASLFRRTARVHNRALKPFDLSAVQAHILIVLWLEGPMTTSELQSQVSLGSSTLSGAIDRMEKDKLLRRVPMPDDRRAALLEPAPWPAKRREAVLEAFVQAENACYADLSREERRTLLTLMHKALASVKKADKPGAFGGDA